MKDPMKIYDIPITSLKVGVHTFNYEVTQDLMDFYGYEDHWDDAKVSVTVTLEKRVNVMRLDIDAVGDIHTWCDVTDEEFRLPIEGHESLTVKVQEIPSDDDQVIVLSPLDTVLNVGQWIYEVIVLSVPQKRYHPSYLETKGTERNMGGEKNKGAERKDGGERNDEWKENEWCDDEWGDDEEAYEGEYDEDDVMDSNIAPIYSTENTEDHSGQEDIDPRWAKLKDILNNKTK